jgi:hypothetical protein
MSFAFLTFFPFGLFAAAAAAAASWESCDACTRVGLRTRPERRGSGLELSVSGSVELSSGDDMLGVLESWLSADICVSQAQVLSHAGCNGADYQLSFG